MSKHIEHHWWARHQTRYYSEYQLVTESVRLKILSSATYYINQTIQFVYLMFLIYKMRIYLRGCEYSKIYTMYLSVIIGNRFSTLKLGSTTCLQMLNNGIERLWPAYCLLWDVFHYPIFISVVYSSNVFPGSSSCVYSKKWRKLLLQIQMLLAVVFWQHEESETTEDKLSEQCNV